MEPKDVDLEALAQDYRDGLTYAKMKEKYHFSNSNTLSRYLKKTGVELNRNAGRPGPRLVQEDEEIQFSPREQILELAILYFLRGSPEILKEVTTAMNETFKRLGVETTGGEEVMNVLERLRL